MSQDSVRALIITIAPEHAGNDSEWFNRINSIITIADNMTSSTRFGLNYDYAVALRAAHILTLSKRSGVGGPVTSKSEGQLSESYGAVGQSDELGSTVYGQQLRTLMKSNIITPMIAGMS